MKKNAAFIFLNSHVTNKSAYYSRGLLSGDKHPATFEASKTMTLATFLLDASGQGLDWAPHVQLMEPTYLTAVEVLASLHLPHPQRTTNAEARGKAGKLKCYGQRRTSPSWPDLAPSCPRQLSWPRTGHDQELGMKSAPQQPNIPS